MIREEAIDIVRKNWPNGRHQLSEALETLIPELKESEDEKMIRIIIKTLQDVNKKYKTMMGDILLENCIAWLEKHGEQKPAWNEEDEKILRNLINNTEKTLFAIKQGERPDIMSGFSGIYSDRLRWLKSLKERMKGE